MKKKKNIAKYIKKEFDKKHGPTWHCIIDRNFGSYVTHEKNHLRKSRKLLKKTESNPVAESEISTQEETAKDENGEPTINPHINSLSLSLFSSEVITNSKSFFERRICKAEKS